MPRKMRGASKKHHQGGMTYKPRRRPNRKGGTKAKVMSDNLNFGPKQPKKKKEEFKLIATPRGVVFDKQKKFSTAEARDLFETRVRKKRRKKGKSVYLTGDEMGNKPFMLGKKRRQKRENKKMQETFHNLNPDAGTTTIMGPGGPIASVDNKNLLTIPGIIRPSGEQTTKKRIRKRKRN
jgi:preprotein translocase subunit YajC|tara:strand:+ start:337 stop:873 length:537 start_codon:yes stop_codon:yes gene_type:complete